MEEIVILYFKTIRWRNFLSTGNVFTEIQLDRSPSTVIVGENGAGKSTILDAICFGLFNKPFRNIKKPQLMNSVNQRDLLVEIDFRIGSNEYQIRRGVKPNIFEIIKNGQLIDQPGAAKDYQDILENQILKLNYKSFTQVVILGSATFTPFMQLSPYDRRIIIEDLLDIQIFSQMNALLKDRAAANKNEQTEVTYQIDLIENKIDVQKKYLDQLKQDIDAQIIELVNERNGLQAYVAEESFEAGEIQAEIQGLLTLIEDADGVQLKSSKASLLMQKLQDKDYKANKRLDFFVKNDHCPTCEQNIDLKMKTQKIAQTSQIIQSTQDGIAKLTEEQNKLTARLQEVNRIQVKIQNCQAEILTIQQDVATTNARIEEYNTKISGLKAKKDLPTEASTEIESLNSELKTRTEQKEQLVKDREVLEIAGHMLKDGGIKTKIIRQYVPIINKLVNKYLAAMDFFVDFTLDEEFNEVIRSRHRDDFSYASFSEGEKARIDISLMLTWRAVAKLKNSVNTNLLILDEVFDGSLDANGIEILMGLFNELHDTNIFVISHKGDMMIDKFRSLIKFEKSKSFSRIAV